MHRQCYRHGASKYCHDDGAQLEHVPELEVLAFLLADLVDDVVEEVNDEADKDELSSAHKQAEIQTLPK